METRSKQYEFSLNHRLRDHENKNQGESLDIGFYHSEQIFLRGVKRHENAVKKLHIASIDNVETLKEALALELKKDVIAAYEKEVTDEKHNQNVFKLLTAYIKEVIIPCLEKANKRNSVKKIFLDIDVNLGWKHAISPTFLENGAKELRDELRSLFNDPTIEIYIVATSGTQEVADTISKQLKLENYQYIKADSKKDLTYPAAVKNFLGLAPDAKLDISDYATLNPSIDLNLTEKKQEAVKQGPAKNENTATTEATPSQEEASFKTSAEITASHTKELKQEATDAIPSQGVMPGTIFKVGAKPIIAPREKELKGDKRGAESSPKEVKNPSKLFRVRSEEKPSTEKEEEQSPTSGPDKTL